jgi:hypothetical protein
MLFGSGRSRTVAVPPGGMDVPFFLLNGTCFVVRLLPTTLAAGVCIAIRDKVRAEVARGDSGAARGGGAGAACAGGGRRGGAGDGGRCGG